MSEEADNSNLSQTSYVPTDYEDNSWEIVGEVSDTEEFVPLAVEVLKGEEKVLDPMFQDYGGISSFQSGKRWHLPDDVAFQSEQAKKKQAENTTEQTHLLTDQEIEALKQEAFQNGAAMAREAAALEAAEQQKAQAQQVAGVIEDLKRQHQEIIAGIENQAVKLALEVGKKIIDGAVEINPEYIERIIHEAIELSGSATIKKIRISPADMEFVNYVELKEKSKEFEGSWQFEADETVKAGCIVETSAGEIDFQLDKAWERVKDNVMKILR